MWHCMLSGGHGVTHIALWGRWRQPQAGVWPGKGWGQCFSSAPQPRGSENVPQDHPKTKGRWAASQFGISGLPVGWPYKTTTEIKILRLVIWRCSFFVSMHRHRVYIKGRSLSMVCKKQSSRYIEQHMKFPYSFTHWKLYICNTVWCICLQNIYLHH